MGLVKYCHVTVLLYVFENRIIFIIESMHVLTISVVFFAWQKYLKLFQY